MLKGERGHGVLIVRHRLLPVATGEEEEAEEEAQEAHGSFIVCPCRLPSRKVVMWREGVVPMSILSAE
jgi:hypothetical protein